MTRREIASRQITLYLPSKADLDRWRKLSDASALPLTKWVYEAVESFVENKPSGLKDTEELNVLRLENAKLKQELEILDNHLRQIQYRSAGYVGELPFSEDVNLVKNLLQNGEIWSVAQLKEQLIERQAKDFPDEIIDSEQTTRDLRKILDDLSAIGVISITGRGIKWNK